MITAEIFKLDNKKTFKEVFENNFNSLCAFGYRYVKDKSAVEDFTQEVFLSLWDKRQDFDHINAVKAYLYTSVRNKCLNQLKHQVVVQKSELALISELENEQLYSSHIIEEETFNLLTIEICDLPTASREIMILALNGLTNPEIAEELNISINTVKTQKKIAYSKLKNKLGPLFRVIVLSF